MLITYFIVLLIAIGFKIMHFPGASLFFVISPLFPLIDLLVQAVRLKKHKGTRILASLSVLFLSVFLTFKFLTWPGRNMLFWIALAISLVYIFRFIQTKSKYNLRYILFSALLLFAVFNFTLKGSDFRLTYLLEDPFNEAEHVPHFYIQSLAREYYVEGDYAKAEQLIERNIRHISGLIEAGGARDYRRENDTQNLQSSISDLSDIRNRSWNTYRPLFEDRELE